MSTVGEMRRISLRRLLSKLTVLALSTSALATANAEVVDDDVAADVPIDREHVAAHDAAAMLGRSLASALAELPPLEAVQLATTWALSKDVLRREAVARSLEWTFPLYADALIIEHLSRDPEAALRAASARAAWVRRTASPEVLDRLVLDSDPEVRSIALRARRG